MLRESLKFFERKSLKSFLLKITPTRESLLGGHQFPLEVAFLFPLFSHNSASHLPCFFSPLNFDIEIKSRDFRFLSLSLFGKNFEFNHQSIFMHFKSLFFFEFFSISKKIFKFLFGTTNFKSHSKHFLWKWFLKGQIDLFIWLGWKERLSLERFHIYSWCSCKSIRQWRQGKSSS